MGVECRAHPLHIGDKHNITGWLSLKLDLFYGNYVEINKYHFFFYFTDLFERWENIDKEINIGS